MGTIMIRCPNTGRAISTGFVAEANEFRRMPVFMARVRCPICRVDHEFFAREAWVEEEAWADGSDETSEAA